MTEHFNKLTPAQAERIAYLMEECGEVISICGKVLRHGLDSYHPEDPPPVGPTNREMLGRELGDVARAVNMLQKAGDIDRDVIDLQNRKGPPLQYMHHQEEG